jgi:THO complex subunit 5
MNRVLFIRPFYVSILVEIPNGLVIALIHIFIVTPSMTEGDQVIQNLRDLAAPENKDSDLDAIQIRASALVSRLKALNRAANLATRTQKDATAVARQEMDQSYLGLQNLLYEKRHLEREIEKCRQFACVF